MVRAEAETSPWIFRPTIYGIQVDIPKAWKWFKGRWRRWRGAADKDCECGPPSIAQLRHKRSAIVGASLAIQCNRRFAAAMPATSQPTRRKVSEALAKAQQTDLMTQIGPELSSLSAYRGAAEPALSQMRQAASLSVLTNSCLIALSHRNQMREFASWLAFSAVPSSAIECRR